MTFPAADVTDEMILRVLLSGGQATDAERDAVDALVSRLIVPARGLRPGPSVAHQHCAGSAP